jgi:hypothetical protein
MQAVSRMYCQPAYLFATGWPPRLIMTDVIEIFLGLYGYLVS